MKLGIIGLPNVGKSSLFNAITKSGAPAENYPFCTIEPNVGVVSVPDFRVDKLADIYKPKKTTHAVIEFCDIAGLVKGASKGEGLGNRFLGHIREVEAICHVVRCFEDKNITHVDGSIDPARDIETVNFELLLSDIEILERRIAKIKNGMKGGNKEKAWELSVSEKVLERLNSGKNARGMALNEDEAALVEGFGLLSYKPVIYVANIGEDELSDGEKEDFNANPFLLKVKAAAKAEGARMAVICAGIEAEMAELSDADRAEFLSDLGIKESGLEKLVKASYSLLGLISFLTAGPDECRAWTIKAGTKAPKAAGKIHSDFEKGFIRAETISYENFAASGFSVAAAREKGLIRSEGKEYVMQDGDIVNFLFNV